MVERRFINGFMDKENLVLLFRDEAGRLMKKVVTGEHVAYFKADDVTPAVKSAWDVDSRILAVEEEGTWVRVSFRAGYWDSERPNKWTGRPGMWVPHREEVCKEWRKKFGIASFEGDVSPLRRLMSDRGLQIARPKRCFLDLETDSRVSFANAKNGRARILSWAIVSESGEQWSGLLNADSDSDEIRLLTEMWQVLDNFDQIVAWNGDGFDFPVMKARTKYLEVPVKDMRRWLYLDHMICFKRNNLMSAESGDEKQSFKLDAIATSLLGEGKHDVDGSKTWEYWANGGTQREALLKYNVQDTDLLRRIEAKTGYLDLFQTLCEVCNVFPDSRALKPTQQVDGYLLRLGVQRGVHFPTRFFGEKTEMDQFRGAFVMEPKCRGITKNIHVADFASLYPSIMITWNLSPDTKLRREDSPLPSSCDTAAECISPSTGIVCRTDVEGILCTALLELMRLRAAWNKRRAECAPGTPEAKEAERRTNAYKTATNSFYGVMGTPFARYYDKDISESTTLNGQWLIKQTIAAAESQGWEVVYGDTDSIFVVGPTKDEFDAFVKWCNTSLYPQLLEELGCKVNKISLAYEKEFERAVFTSAKRYSGRFSHYKGKAATADSKPEVKGLEYKRGDANRLARKLQADAIALLMKGCETPESFVSMIDTAKAHVLEDSLDISEVMLSKSLSKEIHEYVTKTKQDGSESAALPHVIVAKQLIDRGEDISVGSRIAYVVTDAVSDPTQVIPADDYKGECDRFYLWENLVYPPTQRLLAAAFPDFDWAKWEKVRPSKPRGKRSNANPNQGTLFDLTSLPSSVQVVLSMSSQLESSFPMVAPMVRRSS